MLLKATAAAVGDRFHRVQARPAAAHHAQHLIGALDPEIGILQAREAGVARILGGRRRPDRDRSFGRAGAQRRVRRGDLRRDVFREVGLFDPAAQCVRACGYRVQVLRIQRCDRQAHRRISLERRHEALECGCSHHEPRRNRDTCALELAEAPGLAADVCPVAERDVGEPADDGTLPFLTPFHRYPCP